MHSQNIFIEIREKAGLTQDQLSERLGIPQTTWSEYERGKRQPSPKGERIELIIKFAQKIGLRIKKKDIRPDIFD